MLEELLKQLAATSPVEWLGMTTGIAGVWLSIKEKIWAWPLFIVCYGCYVMIGRQSGLLALMGMNVVFIGMASYGWWRWARIRDEVLDALPVTRTKASHWPLVVSFLVLATAGIGWLLGKLGEASLPYVDAFAACCALVAQWMLSHKHIETWIFWIVSDIVYLGIFFHAQSWPSVILFAAFIGLAIKGWREWRPIISQK